ncbi:MAG: succinylglutamate desuccinylase/aspartoacylase family protein [Pseudobdellovibrionaceae bacterium]|nr:succinylglutamate desuccinylase/aspartoacylase family protein [Bdellovibrionales bacterium]USN48095.1 MAG: succinylglutamate desuccinylase/aspartoacylase family protein [Pseudobdellovibrionaceae bacterium]
MTKIAKAEFKIGGLRILPGERKRLQIKVAALFDYTDLNMPLEVIRGKADGPTMFISAAIHGDEINGVEIIKRLLQHKALNKINGTLIVIPVVNVFGFNHKSRYLPDRRDLNRSFPGSPRGSLAGRLAHIFMKEIVSKCTHGIDLHTGANHRANLPQIRAYLDDVETAELARGFGVPIIVHSQIRDGSLREAARNKKVKVLLFEGGEALRFDEDVIKSGLKGCLSVMRKIGMLPGSKEIRLKKRKSKSFVSRNTYWVRANHSGSFRLKKNLGDHVKKGDVLAIISDPFGSEPYEIKAESGGIVIGVSQIPLVNRGDAIFHIAEFFNPANVKRAIDLYG